MNISVQLKKLASDSFIYGISNVLSKFINIFLVPIYTAFFTPDDYGIISIITNFYLLLTILLVAGLDNSAARWFYDTSDVTEKKRIISTWLWFYLLISVIAGVLVLLGAGLLGTVLFDDPGTAFYFRIVAFVFPFTALINVTNNVLRFKRKPVATVTLTLTQTILILGLNLLFILYFKTGLKGIYYSMLISAVVTAAFSIFFIRSSVTRPFIDKAMLKAMLVYSLPFIPASVAFWVTNLSGTFFINEYLGKHASGLYQIGAMIASGAVMITSAFQQAWSPFAFSIMHQPKAPVIYSRVLLWYTGAMLAVCVGLSLFSHEFLVLLTSPAYYGAENVIMILSFSYFFMGLIYIADLGAAIAKQTRPLGFILTVSAITFPVLTIALMPIWGKEGAAAATCISQLIVPVYMFIRSQKMYYIPYQFGKVLLLLAFSIVLLIAGKTIPYFIASFWLRAALFLVYAAATLPLLGLYRKGKGFMAEK